MLKQPDDREAVIAAVVEAMGSGSCFGMGAAAVARGVITRYWDVVEATLLRQGWATPARIEQAEEREARLVAALEVADTFLAHLGLPGSEPLNSVNAYRDRGSQGQFTAQSLADARECRAVTRAALSL